VANSLAPYTLLLNRIKSIIAFEAVLNGLWSKWNPMMLCGIFMCLMESFAIHRKVLGTSDMGSVMAYDANVASEKCGHSLLTFLIT